MRKKITRWTKYEPENYWKFNRQPDPIEIQLGYELIPLVDKSKTGAPLLKKLETMRNRIDAEYGIPCPKIHITDNMFLDHNEYAIVINGVEIDRFKGAAPDKVLVMDTENVDKEKIIGEHTKDPAFGMDAVIVNKDESKKAENLAYHVVDFSTVICTHLTELILTNADKIINQHIVNMVIEKVRKDNPDVVEDVLINKYFSITELKTILIFLISERVPICDMNTIFETLADYYGYEKRLEFFAQKCRRRLARQILLQRTGKQLHVIRLSDEMDDYLLNNMEIPKPRVELPFFNLDPQMDKKLRNKIYDSIQEISSKGYQPVILCSEDIRFAFAYHFKNLHSVCISKEELREAGEDFSVTVEEVIPYDRKYYR